MEVAGTTVALRRRWGPAAAPRPSAGAPAGRALRSSAGTPAGRGAQAQRRPWDEAERVRERES